MKDQQNQKRLKTSLNCMLLVPKEAYNSSGLLNISSKSRNNTSVYILELYSMFKKCLIFKVYNVRFSCAEDR